MKRNALVTDFTQGNVPRSLLTFALPLYLANLLQIAYNMADMVIVGQAMGKVGLSAVSIGGDITNFLTFFSMGFSGAGQVIIAQLLGEKKSDRLVRFIGSMACFLLIFSALLTVICFLGRDKMLSVMNTPAESYTEALAYSTVTIGGLVFIYGYNAVSAILRGLGDSLHPFLFISLAAILNVLLDAVFVLLWNMGAMGAGLATVISQGASFFACLLFLRHHRRELGFAGKSDGYFRPDKELLCRLVKLGLPMAIKSASISFSKLFVNSWINSYGVEVSAFAGIANKLSSVSNLLGNALNMAGASMVGQNIGAKKYERVTQILRTVFTISLSLAASISALLLLFPADIFRLFTSETAVIDIGLEYLPIAVLIFFGSACRAPMNALINGSGNYTANFLTAIFDGIILRMGLAILFGLYLGMGYIGFWLGDALAGFTPLVIGTILYFSGMWKKVP